MHIIIQDSGFQLAGIAVSIVPERRFPYAGLAGNPGPEYSSCKEYVKENNLESAVIFTGYRSDVNKLMMAFDSLAMPSHFEGLPITLIEA